MTRKPHGMIGFQEPTWNLSAVCICSHEARRHHPRGSAHPFTCSICGCMYFETPPIADDRPLEIHIADAIRCTTHIQDAALRGKYVAKDLEIRGYVIQRVRRDERGRFAA